MDDVDHGGAAEGGSTGGIGSNVSVPRQHKVCCCNHDSATRPLLQESNITSVTITSTMTCSNDMYSMLTENSYEVFSYKEVSGTATRPFTVETHQASFVMLLRCNSYNNVPVRLKFGDNTFDGFVKERNRLALQLNTSTKYFEQWTA